jgi:hypothetical protein
MGLVTKCRHGRGRSGSARPRAWAKYECLWLADLRVDRERRYVPLGHDAATARAALGAWLTCQWVGHDSRQR